MNNPSSFSHTNSSVKTELKRILDNIVSPAISRLKTGEAGIHLGETGAGYDKRTAEMEGLSRLMWGVAPSLAGGHDTSSFNLLLEGIKNGTDPTHPAYWGQLKDYDQMLVEMSVYGYALCLIPEQFQSRLTKDEQERFYVWLQQSSQYRVHDCNWLFFPVLVQLGLKNLGASYCQKTIDETLTRVEAFYLGKGWYADGEDAPRDYYVSFAIHYFSLFYAAMMEQEDPERAALYKKRATLFAKDFIHWFDEKGRAVPFGRSMTYRFAQAAFWSAIVFAEVEVEPFSLADLKGILLRHMREWMSLPIFDPSGVLTIGYAYPNLNMSESYNSPGSPYWALKTFLIMALPDEHPFWSVEATPMPQLEKVSVQKEAQKVLVHEQNHTAIFNAGHTKTNGHTHAAAKYEKFVYSSHFGYSVPRGDWGLEQGAFDSMLALSENDNIYRGKRYSSHIQITDEMIYMQWHPWHDVEIETWMIPDLPTHLRVHQVKTARALTIAEAGFAIGLVEGEMNHNQAAYYSSQGSSAIHNLYGYKEASLLIPNANTNLINPRTYLPTLKTELSPGTHIVAAIIYGSPEEEMQPEWESDFNVQYNGQRLSFYRKHDSEALLELER